MISISVNGENLTIAKNSTLSNLISIIKPQQPFAVAVNTVFIARANYDTTVLNNKDCIDIVNPVAGG